MTRGGIASTVLLAAVAGASWLLADRRDERAAAPAAITSADLGYYLNGARLVGLDEAGRELYTLRAERIEQRPADDSVALERVTLEYGAEAGTPWTARADAARIPAGGDLIELAGDVRLVRAGATGAERLDIATTRLELALRERVARTSEPVALTQGRDSVTATGLEADLRRERLRLLSRVRARFVAEAS